MKPVSHIANNEMSSVSNSNFQNYLKSLGLPYNNVIVPVADRQEMQKMLPDFISKIPLNKRKQSVYISKFVASAAIGLNDAALNYLWDAVVKDIRELVISYGLNIFYDRAVGGSRRSHYKTKDDLSRISDRNLLNTCRKLGIISDIACRELVHVLNCRNNIGASHPNNAQIGPAELLSALEVSIKYVFKHKISKDTIKVPKLIKHIRYGKDALKENEVNAIISNFKNMSLTECNTMLKTLFGIFTDTSIHNDQSKRNVLLIAPALWKCSDDSTKYKFGVDIRGFEENFDPDKEKLGVKFLSKCNGLNYETKDDKFVHLSNLSNELIDEHYDYDNYYNEVPTIQDIMKYLKSADGIPKNVEHTLIFVILQCSLGKPGISYCDGVSLDAQPYYHKFFSLLNEDQIKLFFVIVVKNKATLALNDENCNKHFLEILSIFKSSPDLSDSLLELINYFFSNKNLNADQLLSTSKFLRIYNHVI